MADLVERLRMRSKSFRSVDEGNTATLLDEGADRLTTLESEAHENARLLGMGGEREANMAGEIERLKRQVAALEAEASKGERWQSIETAPRDGREVLITDGDAVGAGFYDDAPMAHRADAGWFWEDDRANLLIAKNAGATHWMPLPAPPQDNREG